MSEDAGEGRTTGPTRYHGTPASSCSRTGLAYWPAQASIIVGPVVGSGGIGSTLLPFLAASDVGRITVVNHNDAEVYNLRRQVIHTEGRRGTSKDVSACDAMRALNLTASVMDVTEPLTWDNSMELVRDNNCVVETSNNPCMWYLINDAFVMAGREL